MKLLGLDTASTVGFAYGVPGRPPVSGRYCVRDVAMGYFFRDYVTWLNALIKREGIGDIAFEQNFISADKGYIAATKQYGIIAHTYYVASLNGLHVKPIVPTSHRKNFIGRGNAPKEIPKARKRAWLKKAVIDECRRRGFDPIDDNEADALSVWHALAQIRAPEAMGTIDLEASMSRQ